ncbi:hypothetical protein B296_00034783 [Ensete ventricosum]|uniref:Uncharacterized protein n=1 Tax=Ensete ventricosum TaxID=4639 RepID=A0A426YIX4_ENSVE|nr:hypothetical protein B296_00034783 [Ensete ventricosum]
MAHGRRWLAGSDSSRATRGRQQRVGEDRARYSSSLLLLSSFPFLLLLPFFSLNRPPTIDFSFNRPPTVNFGDTARTKNWGIKKGNLVRQSESTGPAGNRRSDREDGAGYHEGPRDRRIACEKNKHTAGGGFQGPRLRKEIIKKRGGTKKESKEDGDGYGIRSVQRAYWIAKRSRS